MIESKKTNEALNETNTQEIQQKLNTLDALIKLRSKKINNELANDSEEDEEEMGGLPGYQGIF